MWIFGYGKSKKSSSSSRKLAAGGQNKNAEAAAEHVVPASYVYAVEQEGGGGAILSLHADSRGAIVEASKLDLVSAVRHATDAVDAAADADANADASSKKRHVVRAIELIKPAESDTVHVHEPEHVPGGQEEDLSKRLTLEELPQDARDAVELLRVAEEARLAERADRVRRIADAIREPWRALNEDFKAKEARCTAAKQAAANSYVRDRGMSAARVREICDANDMALQMSRDVLKDRGEKLVRNAVGIQRSCSITLDDVLPVL